MGAITKHPGIHEELLAIIAATLVDGGVAPHAARALAEESKERIRRLLGGQKLYIPSTKYTLKYLREEIIRRWDGSNTRELCRELEIAESRLRQIHAEERQRRRVAKLA